MRLFHNPEREQADKLEKFRQSFLALTADGTYPPDRQLRLFEWCRTIGLDWNEARCHVRTEALEFFNQSVAHMRTTRTLTADDAAEIKRLQRRLGLDLPAPARLARPVPQPVQQPVQQVTVIQQVGTHHRRIGCLGRMVAFVGLSSATLSIVLITVILLLMLYALCMAFYYLGAIR